MASQLDGIAALPDQKSKVERYRDVLKEMVASRSVADLQAFVDHSELPGVPSPVCVGIACCACFHNVTYEHCSVTFS